MIRRPCQNRFVPSSSQSDILNSHNIEIGLCAEQRAKNVVIEILVGKPLQHGYRAWRSSNRARIQSGGHRDSFDLRISSPLSRRFVR